MFDLETLSCLPDCGTQQIKLSDIDMFQISGYFCRNKEYYIDSTSQQILELGTKAFPYRTIKPVFSEILKHISHQQISISVFLKENTNTFLEDSSAFIINITAINIQSYSDTINIPDKATIITTESAQPGLSGRAAFNIVKDVSQNISAVILGKPFLDYELKFIGRTGDGFQVVRSTIALENIIARRQAIDKMNGVFIYLLYLQQSYLILSKKLNLMFREHRVLCDRIFCVHY